MLCNATALGDRRENAAIAVLGSEAALLLLSVVVSTVLGMAAAALAFAAVARATGNTDD